MSAEKRWLLFLILTLVVLQLFSFMRRRAQPPEPQAPGQPTQVGQATPAAEATPEAGTAPPPAVKEGVAKPAPQPEVSQVDEEIRKAREISVRTRLFDVTFTTLGAKPLSWKIVDERFTHFGDQAGTASIQIIPQTDGIGEGREFPLEIGLKEYNGRDFTVFNSLNFAVARDATSAGDVSLTFTSPQIEGIEVVKKFSFQRASYLVSLSVTVRNASAVKYRFNEGGNGMRVSWGAGIGSLDPERKADWRYITPLYLTERGVQSARPKIDRSVDFMGKVEWGGLEDRFFVATIIPVSEAAIEARSLVKAKNLTDAYQMNKSLPPPFTLELFAGEFSLDPGQEKEFAYKVYVGPKELSTLNEAGYRLSKILFHTSWNWMRALCILLLKVLKFFVGVVGNYGIAIILLTLSVRVVMHPLTHKAMKIQAKTMAEQMRLKPYIDEINKKHKGNPQMRNKEIMKLYKEHNVNPLGMMRGCLPLMLQMPIFFALYRVLMDTIDLRGATFLWIKDLSGPDALVKLKASLPFLGPNINLLPILMGLSQIVVSKFSTMSKDPTQRQMMVMMPIFMTLIFYNLPAGLVLYWLLSNIWQTAHQLLANEIIQKEIKEAKKQV